MPEDGKIVFKVESDSKNIDKALDETEEKVKKQADKVDEALKKGAQKTGKTVSDDIKNSTDKVTGGLEHGISGLGSGFAKIVALGKSASDKIGSTFNGIASPITGVFTSVTDKVKNRFSNLTGQIKTGVSEAADAVKRAAGIAETSVEEDAAKAEKKVKDAAKNAGDSVNTSAKKSTKETTDTVSAGHGKLAGMASGLGLALGGAFAAGTTAAVAFGKKGIELASDLNEVQNVVDTTFGKNSDKIEAFSKKAASSFGLSELQAKQYTSTLGAMYKSMGLSSQATLEMSEKMTGLAGDFASFYNLDPADAFEKIRAGVSGETEPLKQLGINMSDANLQAFALSEGIKTQVGKMTQAQQATLRYNYLLSVSKDSQGDFAKTSSSFANQQRIMAMEFDQISASIGSALLPVLNQLLSAIRSMFLENGQATEGLKAFFQQLASIALKALPPLLAAFGQLMPVLMSLVSQLLPPLLNTLNAVTPPLVKMTAALLPVIVSLIKELLPPAVKIFNEIMPLAVQLLNQLLPPLLQIVRALLPPLLAVINAILPPVMQIIRALLPPLIGLLKSIAPVIQALAPLISWLAAVVGDVLGAQFKTMAPIITNFINVLKNIIRFVKDVFTGNWKDAWAAVKDIFGNLFAGLGGLVKLPLNTVINVVNAAIKGFNKIKLPDWVPGLGGMGINIPLIPHLAKGALAFGPQLALVGDNPNASVDPEVVAPLSKLKTLMTASIEAVLQVTSPSAPREMPVNVVVQPAPVELNADARKLGLAVTGSQWAQTSTRRYR